MEISIGSYSFRLEIVILLVVLTWVMFGHMLCSCCSVSLYEGFEMIKGGAVSIESMTPDASGNMDKIEKEGFVGNSNAYEPEFSENNSPGYILSPDKWTSVVSNMNHSSNMNMKQNSNPDEMDIFARMQFKPECCPNTYSSSEGCACMNNDTYNLLKNRGGNNVPYSEY